MCIFLSIKILSLIPVDKNQLKMVILKSMLLNINNILWTDLR